MLSRKSISWAAALFLLVSSLGAAEVCELSIEGNQISGDRIFYRNLRTRVGEAYVPIILNEDIKRLYELGHFKTIEVKEDFRDDGSVALLLKVVERPVIASLRFEGLQRLNSSKFDDEMRSAVGDRYDKGTAISDVNLIARVCRESGHLFAVVDHRVEPSAAGEAAVDLVFSVLEEAKVKIGDIVFNGNDHMPDSRLKKVMETKIDRFFASGTYDPEVFALDLKKMESYYRSMGYLDAEVLEGKSSFSENGQWLYLHVDIDEGPLYVIDEIRLEGNETLSESFLLDRLVTREGAPFSNYVPMDLVDRLEKAYGEIGRVFTVVTVDSHIKERGPYVSLTVTVKESQEVYLNRVRIEGNNKTKDVVIRRELEFYPGERINTDLVDRSERNLANTGYFSRNDIEIQPTIESDKADILIRVEERETGSINFALGFSSVENIFGQVKYEQRNFDWRDREKGVASFFSGDGYIGDGQRLSVAINTGSRSKRFQVDFSEPWVFNRKIRFGFGVYHTENQRIRTFDRETDGFNVRIGKEFWRDVDGFLTYTLNQNKIDNMDASMSQAYKDQQGTTLVSSLNNYWVYEGRDNRIFTTDGWFVRPSVTLAGGPLGGDQSFYKFEFEAKHYHMVFDFGDQKEHVLSHRLKLGYVDHFGDSDEVSIFQHFYAGGMGSVRGFENGSLGPRDGGFEIGGRFQTVYNLEYSIPINQRSIRGIMFWDTGNVFSGITQFKAKELRSSVGFGLRLQIPALGQMPLALDFAKPIRSQDGDDEEVFSFNFGNFF